MVFTVNQGKKHYAQWFVKEGYAIFPVDPLTKKPMVKEWQRYSTTPLTEEEKKRYLEMVDQGFNYAVPGGQKNLVILDVEDKELLKSWFGKALDELCGQTLCVDTVHGGVHIYLEGDEIPEHKFNPVFTKDGKGIADLQSFSSYVVGPGSCINHKFCEVSKCQWRGQDHLTCYSISSELKPFVVVKLKEFLKILDNEGKKIGITLSKNAHVWVYGERVKREGEQAKRENEGERVEDLEELKKEIATYNRYEGKTVDAIRKEVCQSIKRNLEYAQSEEAKFTVSTAYAVVCEGKTYADLNLNDRSVADWSVLRVLLNHGVGDVDVLQQLLPKDSKVFAPKSDNYFAVTLKNAWEDVKPYLKIVKNAKGKKVREVKREIGSTISRRIIERYQITTFVQRHNTGESLIGIFQWNDKMGIYDPIDETIRRIIRTEIMNLTQVILAHKGDDEGDSISYYEVDDTLVDKIYDEIKDLTLTRIDMNDPLRIAFPNYTIEWSDDKSSFLPKLYTSEERTKDQFAFHYVPHKIHGDVLKREDVLDSVEKIEELARQLCPKTLEAFKKWAGEKWITLFEIIGYTLYPAMKFKLAFMLLGPRDSGKTSFLQLLNRALGRENTLSARVNELFNPNNRFHLGFLFHKLVNTTAETKEYSIEDIDKFKTATGGDQITSDVKFKGPITFTNYAKLVIASNKLPDVRDKNDTAFWRRWLIVEFPNQFPNDDTWFQTTFTEEEIEGMLTLSILAFARVYKNGKFDYQQTPEEIRDMWLNNIDSVWSFIKTSIEKELIVVNRGNADLWVTRKQLYGMYKDYCWNHGFTGVSMRVFANKLNKYFGITGMKKNFGQKPDGTIDRRRCFVGIAVNKEVKTVGEIITINEGREFVAYATENNRKVKEFWEIVQDFEKNQNKANKFIKWCMEKNMCIQRKLDVWEIVAF